MIKEIIVLAKSDKVSGFCIAGVDTSTGEWIRPISKDIEHEGAVPRSDIMYEDGTELQLFDIVKIEFIKHSPSFSQPENYVYDETKYWLKTGVSSIDFIKKLRGLDTPSVILHNERRDVLDEEIEESCSLLIVKIENPVVNVTTYPEKKKITMSFTYNGETYSYFSISDRTIKHEYSMKPDGYYRDFGSNTIATISLTGKYLRTGKYYKMIAHVFDE